LQSIEIVSESLGNFYYKRALFNCIDKVKKGEALSKSLKEEGIFPLLVSQMLAVGEETGETSAILAKLADFYEQELKKITKNMSSIIEPVLMLVIGAVVGFFAVSMFQPIYSLLQQLQKSPATQIP